MNNYLLSVLFILASIHLTTQDTSSTVTPTLKDNININNKTSHIPDSIEIGPQPSTSTPPPTTTANVTTSTPNTTTPSPPTPPTKPTTSPPTTKPTTTPVTPTTSKTTTSGTTTTTSSTTTQKPTTPSHNSTTAIPPTTASPVTTEKPEPEPHRRFDGPSFIGGIVLALGLVAIGFVAFKFYKARLEVNYHTL